MKIELSELDSPKGNISIYKITNNSGAWVELSSLGAGITSICVPDKEKSKCFCRLPCRLFQSQDFCFNLTDDCGCLTVPVIPGKDFLYLDKLKTARLQITNGQYQIMINPNRDLPDSDRNQGYL